VSKSRRPIQAQTYATHAKRTVVKARADQRRERDKYEKKKILREPPDISYSLIQFSDAELAAVLQQLEQLARIESKTKRQRETVVFRGDVQQELFAAIERPTEPVPQAAPISDAAPQTVAPSSSCENDLVSFVNPPTRAEFLLYLVLDSVERECVPGDLAEEFNEIVLPRFGLRRARLWYWSQVLRSLISFASRRFLRVVKWAVLSKTATALWKKYLA